MRAENILIESLSDARYFPNEDSNSAPAATWIRGISKYFIMKSDLKNRILENFCHNDLDYHNFIMKFFRNELPDIFDTEASSEWCVEAISVSIRSGNEFVKDRAKDFLTH
jgi:hypothetical protein